MTNEQKKKEIKDYIDNLSISEQRTIVDFIEKFIQPEIKELKEMIKELTKKYA